MGQKQHTIRDEVVLSGVGLHTGNRSTVRLKPAAENTGIRFIRVDLPDQPVIPACVESVLSVEKVPRCTSIGRGEGVAIHTVEHLMSALCGLGIDNLVIEIDNNELPGLDGSSLEYFKAIKNAGVVEQVADREYIEIKEPIGVNRDGSSILIVPHEQYKVFYTLNYNNHPFLNSQFYGTVVNEETFECDLAPSRTFCLEEEAKQLQEAGLGKGANYRNTLVVGKTGVIDNTVRFPDEFARHKVLDFVGDLYLLGKPIRGQVFAVKSGHTLNIELMKRISKQKRDYEHSGFIPQYNFGGAKELDIHQIMKILPHRYPFLLVDRIIELEPGKKAVGIKNVTINDNYFRGHFPSRPVMPGVLMVEALAQTGGVLVLTNPEHHGKVALFMAADKVKFRKLVEPGDQLHLEVEVVRDRAKTAALKGVAKVNGEVVTEADLVFSFTDIGFLH